MEDQDHDAYWADNAEMKQKTKAYAERARHIADHQMLKRETFHPWRLGPHDISCKLDIYELEGDHIGMDNGPASTSPRDLLMHWENTPKDGTAKKRNRRVIILEDVTARLAETLGVLLDIPPEFFLSHCDEFVDLNVMDERFAKQGSSVYWKVAVPQKRQLPEGFSHHGVADAFCGTFQRGAVPLDESISWVSFRSFISYWGKTYEPDGSWTAVFLIDPQLTHLHLHSAPNQDDGNNKILLENWEPTRDVLREVIINSSEAEHTQVYQRSIFATLSKAHSKMAMVVTNDVFSATYFARNCIRAVWEEHVWRRERDIHDVMFGDEESRRKRGNTTLESDQIEQTAERVKAYERLMMKRQSVNSDKRELQAITWKFRLRDAEYLSKDKELRPLIIDERSVWNSLERTFEGMEDILSGHMKMYSIRATMEEASEAKVQSLESFRQTKAANRMARSSGQLTKIATVVVPCSFVASIFSMNGEFAAGESLFYIYWAISVPVTLGLLIWVIHEDVSKGWSDCKEWMGSTLAWLPTWRRSKAPTAVMAEKSEV
ncbi:uncharacterized protein Triagg1_3302 [Trichoderma aggressivum f. europaeum]|uniref:Uncharacterized protein n=1 Tax=Trichoderma aggressivum f. europaeum TaxID=173218 RepID=A0AAE1IGP9_9HYPO|nr:hypothetical protein Triagg1_3302 [Trichoderma aggressivum f. europaeum]